MSSITLAQTHVFSSIAELAGLDISEIKSDTALIGAASILDSMRLVELCLVLEDKASELGFEFDWTSESALSRSRSMFRNAGALAEEFARQKDGA